MQLGPWHYAILEGVLSLTGTNLTTADTTTAH